MFQLEVEPASWDVPTACSGWEVRDMVGHLVAETEGYLSAFESARHGVPAAGDPVGVAGMAKAADEAAPAFRPPPRGGLIERLRDDTDRLTPQVQALPGAHLS